MLDNVTKDQLTQYVNAARSVVIALAEGANQDQVASGLSLANALRQTGRDVVVVSPGSLNIKTVQQEQIQTQLGNRDLTVSFPYDPAAVDKVSYNIDQEQQRFSLVIKPQKGHRPLGTDAVNFSYTGADTDLIFLIGVNEFEELQHLYYGYEQLYQDTPIISFHTYQTEIGTVKIDASQSSSLSEATAELLRSLGLVVSGDSATDLLAVIEQKTEGFKSLRATADTFLIISELLRAGGRRSRAAAPSTLQPPARNFKPVATNNAPQQATPSKKKQHKNGAAQQQNPKKKPQETQTDTGSLKYQPSGFSPSGRN